MKKWTYLTLLAACLLVLAVGGWVVQGIRTVLHPSRLEPQTA